jgi:hypothetical protein
MSNKTECYSLSEISKAIAEEEGSEPLSIQRVSQIAVAALGKVRKGLAERGYGPDYFHSFLPDDCWIEPIL